MSRSIISSACVFARQFWNEWFSGFGLQELTPQTDNVDFYAWWQLSSDRLPISLQQGFNTLVVLGTWSIWKTRNDVVFNGAAPRINMLECERRRKMAECLSILNIPKWGICST